MKSLSPDIMELWLNNYRNVDLFPPAIGTDGHSCYLRLPVWLLTRPFRNILPFQIKCMYAYLYGSWLFEIKLFGQICKFSTNLKFSVATVELAWEIMLRPLERSRPSWTLRSIDVSIFPGFLGLRNDINPSKVSRVSLKFGDNIYSTGSVIVIENAYAGVQACLNIGGIKQNIMYTIVIYHKDD